MTYKPLVEYFRDRCQIRALELAEKVTNAGLRRLITNCPALTPSELVLHALRSDALNWVFRSIETADSGIVTDTPVYNIGTVLRMYFIFRSG